MSIIELIKQRRSIGKMTTEVPTRAQIETILEAATHAPNHHNAEPWRFFVLAGKARVELGEIMAESFTARMAEANHEKFDVMIAKERNKPLRAPVLIAVIAEQPKQPKEIEIENIEAASAAVQNMLLAAEELGLAAMWRTGEPAYDPKVKQWLGLEKKDHIVAFVYLGYPAMPRLERIPISAAKKTTWLGW